jgi:hypothetical protein
VWIAKAAGEIQTLQILLLLCWESRSLLLVPKNPIRTGHAVNHLRSVERSRDHCYVCQPCALSPYIRVCRTPRISRERSQPRFLPINTVAIAYCGIIGCAN